jgi:hypothetical protein
MKSDTQITNWKRLAGRKVTQSADIWHGTRESGHLLVHEFVATDNMHPDQLGIPDWRHYRLGIWKAQIEGIPLDPGPDKHSFLFPREGDTTVFRSPYIRVTGAFVEHLAQLASAILKKAVRFPLKQQGYLFIPLGGMTQAQPTTLLQETSSPEPVIPGVDMGRLRAARTLNDADHLALGFLRYEALRKVNPAQFAELYRRNMHGDNFDRMVDVLAGVSVPTMEETTEAYAALYDAEQRRGAALDVQQEKGGDGDAS